MKKLNKQNIIYISIIILVSLFVSRYFIFQNNAMIENDVDFHYARVLSTIRGWIDHQFIPQLDPEGASNFGYSWNIFYGPLPTYFIAIVYFFIHNLALSINSLTVLVVCLIGVMMYKYIYYRTVSEKSSLVASIALITSTTILNNLYQYTGFGPLFGTFFSIVALYGVQIILDKEKNNAGIILLAIGGAGVLLSHTLSCIIIIFYLFWILLANLKNVLKRLKSFVIAGILSFGLSAFFILPFLEAKNYQLYNQFNKKFTEIYMWKNPDSMNFGRSDLGNILFSKLGVSSYPSILFWISFILCVVVCFIKLNHVGNRKNSILLFVLASSTLFLGSNLIDWNHLPSFTWTLQSPIRIMFYASGLLFSVSIGLSMSFLVEKRKKEKFSFLLTFFMVFLFVFIANSCINSSNNAYHKKTVSLEKIAPSSAIAFEGNGGAFLKTAIGEFFPSAIGTEEKSLKQIIKENTSAFYLNSDYIYPSLDKRKMRGVVFLNSDEKVPENKIIDVPYRSDYKVEVEKSKISRLMEIPKIAYPGYKARITLSSGGTMKLGVEASPNGYVQVSIPKEISGEITIYYGLTKATAVGIILFMLSATLIITMLIINKRT